MRTFDEYPRSSILSRMPTRSRTNPLALAVLACLYERPMHPYEVAQTLRQRAKHESIRLNYGSLYSVVEALDRRGLIRARETLREGRRPERTVYESTDEAQRTRRTRRKERHDAHHRGPGPHQAIRQDHGPRRAGPRGRARAGARRPRSQRRREDHVSAGRGHPAPAGRRNAPGGGPRRP